MGTITDPQNNFVYELHQYLDNYYSGTNATCVSATIGSEVINLVIFSLFFISEKIQKNSCNSRKFSLIFSLIFIIFRNFFYLIEFFLCCFFIFLILFFLLKIPKNFTNEILLETC